MVVSLCFTVSVQETSATALKSAVPRASLAPSKGHRRASLDVSSQVLATPVTPAADTQTVPLPAQQAIGIRVKSSSQAHWTPTWTRTLQTKFSAVWEKWQKLSTQLSQYKAFSPDWVGHTQELFDQQLQRFMGSVGAAPVGRAPTGAAQLSGPGAASTSRPVTLTPYLTVADEVEVSFAAMLSDLCNMAYEVDKVDPELLQAHYQLSLIATSLSCSSACASDVPSSAAASIDGGAESIPSVGTAAAAPARQHQQQHPSAHAHTRQSRHHRSAAPAAVDAGQSSSTTTTSTGKRSSLGVASFPMGGSPPLSPSVSMLQLTSPEAVTAALASQGHGAAFAHPMYVSTLHHALISMGSYDEEGDIFDLELRAAMAARGPGAVLLGGGVGSACTVGTMGTMDEISLAMMQQPLGGQHAAAPQQQLQQQAGAGAEHGTDAVVAGAAVAPFATTDVQAPFGGPRASGDYFRDAVASGTLFSNVSLSEDRDFVAGQVYGYNTQLVERRRSSDCGAGEEALPVAAVAQSGAAGGRALREEQTMPTRRVSSSGMPTEGGAEGAAAAVAVLSQMGNEVSPVAGGPPVVVACDKAPPSAWFACDDMKSRIRYFAIQGSTSLEHWQINLQFEPVVFEDPKYGVRIHRGVYEAAKEMYDDLLPLVQQHLETSPFATVSFTGHSLGGSLGTVLMLLFVVRGVLKPANISPVYTFGAPAVFCQGAVADAPSDRCAKCHLNCEMRPHHQAGGSESPAAAAGGARPPAGPLAGIAAAAASMDQSQVLPLGLLAGLGLSDDQVVNVIMHKDVVPRAFVCDYTAVAGVLQRWWPSFRDHHSLQDDVGPHKSLYNFVGRLAVLRPTSDLPFVNGPADASHPMLPNHPALYRVGVHEEVLPSLDYAAATMASWDELLTGLSSMAGGCRRNRAAAAARRAAKMESMQKGVMQFMNQPHPLATLADYQAYGPHGFISRFHNPDNYTRALRALSGR